MTKRVLHVADFRLLLELQYMVWSYEFIVISIDCDRYQEASAIALQEQPHPTLLESHTRGSNRRPQSQAYKLVSDFQKEHASL